MQDLNDPANIFGIAESTEEIPLSEENGNDIGYSKNYKIKKFEENISFLSEKNLHKKNQEDKRVTLPYLTKYEKARILGARALQISMGAPVLINLEGETDSLEIASRELRKRVIPIIVRRYLPCGKHEDWELDELIIE